jgi:hypothetical protein
VTGQTFTDQVAQAIGDPASIVGPRLDPAETITRWSTRAVLAVLAEQPVTANRQLVIAVRRYLLANGWWLRRRAIEHLDSRLLVDWRLGWAADGKTGRVLEIVLLGAGRSVQRVCLAADVEDVREAVDLAVAYGMLPLAFSSSYRAGLDAAAPVLAVARG